MDAPPLRIVPRPSPAELRRAPLLDILERTGTLGFGALVAPTGFGKTLLLSQYASNCEAMGRDVVRLTLQLEDRGEAAALRRLEAALFGGEARSCPGSPLPRLLVRLGERRPIIMLDCADAPLSIADLLVRGLSRHAPDRLTLFVASREPPPSLAAALARLRGSRLSADDLAFTGSDSSVLLAAAWPGADSADLVALGAGWPLAIGLIAAQITRGSAPEAVGRALVADLAPMVERDILRRLTATLREALTALAVLDSFTPDLAECVLAIPASSVVTTFERLHPWVAAIEDAPGWWRVHPLLAKVLRELEVGRGCTLTKRVQLLVSEWHEWRGNLDEAVAASAAAGAHRRTAELIESADAWRMSLYEGSPRLRNWISKLPENELAAHPRLVIARAYLAMRDGKLDLSARLLSRVREVAARRQDPELQSDLDAVSTLVAYLSEHSLSHLTLRVSEGAAEMRHGTSGHPLLQGTLRCAEANAALTLGMPRVAEACAEKAMICMREAASPAGMAYAHMHAGYAKLHLCALDAADWHFAAAGQIAEELLEREPVLIPIANLAVQTVRLWRQGGSGQRDTFLAAFHLVEASYGWLEIFASAIEAGCVAFAAAQDRQALEMLAAATRRIGASKAMGRLVEFADILDLHAAIIDANPERCHAVGRLLVARSPQRSWQHSPLSWRNHIHTAYAVAHWLGTSRPADALMLVDDAIRCCSTNGVELAGIALRLSRAELLLRLGADAQSFATLREAALPARSRGVAAPFKGLAIGRLLVRAAAAARREGDHQHLETIDFFAESRRASPSRPAGDLAAFSARECEVIAEMLAGASTKSIARSLSVTDHTIKFHLAAIYRKLGVTTRGRATGALFRIAGGCAPSRSQN